MVAAVVFVALFVVASVVVSSWEGKLLPAIEDSWQLQWEALTKLRPERVRPYTKGAPLHVDILAEAASCILSI